MITEEVSLALGTLVLDLELKDFSGLGVSRRPVLAHQPTVQYNKRGLPTQVRTLYEPKHNWAFALNLDEAKLDLLELIASEQQSLFKSGQDGAVKLSDGRSSFVETAPATRLRVAGTVESDPPPAVGSVEYFAVFRVALLLPENYYKAARGLNPDRLVHSISFSATELDKEPP